MHGGLAEIESAAVFASLPIQRFVSLENKNV
ncbi:MAG: hypothetical protein ACI8TA_002686 [Cyclobacteriaceae bacterium]|jgi:hypothetical protein